MIRFFVPTIDKAELAETAYQAIKRSVVKQAGRVSDRRYFAIHHRQKTKALVTEVGKPDPLVGEVVMAIFRTALPNGPFLVCTQTHGVVVGYPVLASGSADTRAIEFEEAGDWDQLVRTKPTEGPPST